MPRNATCEFSVLRKLRAVGTLALRDRAVIVMFTLRIWLCEHGLAPQAPPPAMSVAVIATFDGLAAPSLMSNVNVRYSMSIAIAVPSVLSNVVGLPLLIRRT